MSSLEEIRNERLRKLEILKEKGIDPYPAKSNRTHTIADTIAGFETLSSLSSEITLAGRVMIVRGQGAILFVDLKDGAGKFQSVFKEDEIEKESFDLFGNVIDAGDFIEVTGSLFVTKRGEQSLLVKEWRMLTKSLLPLPDKHSGLKNEDERFRRRYLDLLQDDELKVNGSARKLFAALHRRTLFGRFVMGLRPR